MSYFVLLILPSGTVYQQTFELHRHLQTLNSILRHICLFDRTVHPKVWKDDFEWHSCSNFRHVTVKPAMGDRFRSSTPSTGNLSQYITSQPGQLRLAIPLWIGAVSTSQRAVMPCSWELKAGMVCMWVAGKTVWSSSYHRPYLSGLEMRFLIIIIHLLHRSSHRT